MKNETGKEKSPADSWDNGDLGRDPAHAKAAPEETNKAVDEALGLQMISIRLPKELIEDFKSLAQYHGLGYQPLMRDALKRFASAEMKQIATAAINEKAATEHAASQMEVHAKAA